MKTWIKSSIGAVGTAAILGACGSGATEGEVRIAYFPNLTHIATIVALENDYFAEELGDDVSITTRTVPDGGAFMEAMTANEVDIGTVGPGPAMNTYTRNPAHSIVAGAVNGGAVLMAREGAGIESVADLVGESVAIPTYGSTQDLMLRKALADAGIDADDVNLVPQAPADTSTLFSQEDVAAAATQEPWGSYLADNLNASFLLDADEFAWGEESTNTVVVATHDFMEVNDELTRSYLRAHQRAVDFVSENPDEAAELFVQHIEAETSSTLDIDEIKQSMQRLFPTTDVNEQVLQEMAEISHEADQMTSTDIEGLVDLSYLE
ncbi:ABC-type probable sulfate transporter, periplasmic binding protein [Bacillus sp. JCM 19046]|uniref:NitT/TauT family transport system substrate-binding protein n=1 Tax=Shouchella xiaoxiensis TaxID=766895 RepID=A0ABS2SWT3_9BACI|nr:ABC transporter substrate-binding protein [Shouchella xiaoxiensis]MBM7839995.1 NitT/TauT family transport system substrate-binding protein [Shouchella xiaoxiensis]GAF12644.1 ABC-type probable sulfate transporter, periplasmic binding protein [Bacillus sp. JCM 19045]GAF17794.1 ABC-type probable sulfate transporter, periplasmic binding protein [Bacillus sp. JCM 19046]